MTQQTLRRELLGENRHQAQQNRAHFDRAGVFVVNLMSAPGAGKTTLLEQALPLLARRHRIAVIEGEMASELDADRLRERGVEVLSVTTGRACHLDATMISRALRYGETTLDLPALDVLIVENVGNLVCPAECEIGEHRKVALCSVTEGVDKPLKYPTMFRAADLLVVTKRDLLPYVDVSLERLITNAKEVNASLEVIVVSAKTGDGVLSFVRWIAAGRATHMPAVPALALSAS
ncbi:MAG TPA: hydrogenase nickel incorporation protein HypB [Candidatus Acidoferrales bacterium]|nr:hydrogenase nickel incorporation protein HypB [Candidatus Acidoferrales bacterium]